MKIKTNKSSEPRKSEKFVDHAFMNLPEEEQNKFLSSI